MTTKSPAMMFFVTECEPASAAGSKDIARTSHEIPSHRGYIQGSDPQVPLRGASGSPTAIPHRTLNHWRPVRIDESAICIGAGEL